MKILHLLPPGILVILALPLQQVVVGIGGGLRDPKDPVDRVGRVSAAETMTRKYLYFLDRVDLNYFDSAHLRPGWVSRLGVSGPGLGLS